MSACIIVTQVVITLTAAIIGRLAGRIGRKPFLLAGFACLPIRRVSSFDSSSVEVQP